MRKAILSTLLIAGLILPALSAQGDSQWRGPSRDGIYPGETLLNAWPQDGPPLLWSAGGLGDGYSSAAISKVPDWTWA